MNDPIRHHYSPQFYLRQWAGADGRLFRYHRPHSATVVSRLSPEYTGFEDHLYTVEVGDDPQIIEKEFFSKVDNYAAPILEALRKLGPGLVILDNGHIGNDQRSDWTRFMYSLCLRGPHSLAEINTVLQGTVRDHFEQNHEANRATKQPSDPETIYEHVQRYVPSWWPDAHKFLLTQMIDQEQIGHVMVNMNWAVLDLSDAPHSLLTSDRPYIPSHEGLLSPDCLLSMPLSPTRLFVAANDMRKLEILARQSKKDTVRNANNHLVRMAVENVYGNSADQRAFVEKRLRRADQAPLPGLITLEPRT